MDLIRNIKSGMSRDEAFIIGNEHTAYHIGSGDERVLGTPWMISFMERVSNRLILDNLPEEYMSVGIRVDVKHLAPTPVGRKVHIQVEILNVIKNRVVLKVEAFDHMEKIGEGSHERAIVEKDRFIDRVLKK